MQHKNPLQSNELPPHPLHTETHSSLHPLSFLLAHLPLWLHHSQGICIHWEIELSLCSSHHGLLPHFCHSLLVCLCPLRDLMMFGSNVTTPLVLACWWRLRFSFSTFLHEIVTYLWPSSKCSSGLSTEWWGAVKTCALATHIPGYLIINSDAGNAWWYVSCCPPWWTILTYGSFVCKPSSGNVLVPLTLFFLGFLSMFSTRPNECPTRFSIAWCNWKLCSQNVSSSPQ